MLLIDAVFINNGGGKILLDYLIEEMGNSGIFAYFLLDDRIKNSHPPVLGECYYINGSLISRHWFYRNNKDRFSSVLCFGNVPPTVRLHARVSTYFHQDLFLQLPKNYPLKSAVLLKLKSSLVRMLRSNTDRWIVQTPLIQDKLAKKFEESNEKIKVLPFYPPLPPGVEMERKLNSFVYVSNSEPYKNHDRLLKGFVNFYDKYRQGELHLTLPNDGSVAYQLVTQISSSYPVINHGFLNRKDLATLYRSCEYCVYPSLYESFGLSIIEAIENGCKLIGANRPYMQAICLPSLYFDPLSVHSISHAFEKAYREELDTPKTSIRNLIKEFLGLITKPNKSNQ